jgi:hypothetical protein
VLANSDDVKNGNADRRITLNPLLTSAAAVCRTCSGTSTVHSAVRSTKSSTAATSAAPAPLAGPAGCQTRWHVLLCCDQCLLRHCDEQ